MNTGLMKAVEAFELLPIDHEPDGWPAVRMRDITLVVKALRDLKAENARLKDAVAEWEGEHSLALIRAASADGLLSEVLITAGQRYDMRQLLQRIQSHLQGAGDEAV